MLLFDCTKKEKDDALFITRAKSKHITIHT